LTRCRDAAFARRPIEIIARSQADLAAAKALVAEIEEVERRRGSGGA
jgi:hypothetical protein